MIIQDFNHIYTEALRVRLLNNGRAVLTDANGLIAMVFQYHGSHDDPDELATHVDAAIVDAMLNASLHHTSTQVSDEIANLELEEEVSQ